MDDGLVDISGLENLTKEISLLPSGLSSGNPLNIGKSQARAIYWRPLENGDWAQTAPLPADPMSILYYFGKGFKSRAPERKVYVKEPVS